MNNNRINFLALGVRTIVLGSMSICSIALVQSAALSEMDELLVQDSFALLPGLYYRRSYIGIYQYGNRICYTGGNHHGVTTASVDEDPEKPGVYRVNGFGADTDLYQIDSDNLWFGGAEYERVGESRSFEELGPKVQACLSSQEPYLNQESF